MIGGASVLTRARARAITAAKEELRTKWSADVVLEISVADLDRHLSYRIVYRSPGHMLLHRRSQDGRC